jgi:hypothetical protein
MSGCATAETTLSRDPIIERMSGTYDDRAVCVYDELTKADYEGLRLIENRRQGTTRVFRGDDNSTVRAFDIAFIQENPETVRVEIRGFPTIRGDQYWENQVLPTVRSCGQS